ncbi:BRCA1-associated RING domain protein 1 [Oopsacas minuta]|uniref:BRCA1-associated RING domain protein 1 n=1 Tax=Oopsacas minuta TaxID=111878 RepID=A0AAV7JXE5_9METZ|nr:BRCA1-associated RING domain protein 1 [Oopsacas minuta]
MTSQLLPFTNLLNAISNLEKCLNCSFCSRAYSDPYTLTTCGHTFCKPCITIFVSSHQANCPLCNIPNWLNQSQPNRQLKALLQHYWKLRELLGLSGPVSSVPNYKKPQIEKNRRRGKKREKIIAPTDETNKEIDLNDIDDNYPVDFSIIEICNEFINTHRKEDISIQTADTDNSESLVQDEKSNHKPELETRSLSDKSSHQQDTNINDKDIYNVLETKTNNIENTDDILITNTKPDITADSNLPTTLQPDYDVILNNTLSQEIDINTLTLTQTNSKEKSNSPPSQSCEQKRENSHLTQSPFLENYCSSPNLKNHTPKLFSQSMFLSSPKVEIIKPCASQYNPNTQTQNTDSEKQEYQISTSPILSEKSDASRIIPDSNKLTINESSQQNTLKAASLDTPDRGHSSFTSHIQDYSISQPLIIQQTNLDSTHFSDLFSSQDQETPRSQTPVIKPIVIQFYSNTQAHNTVNLTNTQKQEYPIDASIIPKKFDAFCTIPDSNKLTIDEYSQQNIDNTTIAIPPDGMKSQELLVNSPSDTPDRAHSSLLPQIQNNSISQSSIIDQTNIALNSTHFSDLFSSQYPSRSQSPVIEPVEEIRKVPYSPAHTLIRSCSQQKNDYVMINQSPIIGQTNAIHSHPNSPIHTPTKICSLEEQEIHITDQSSIISQCERTSPIHNSLIHSLTQSPVIKENISQTHAAIPNIEVHQSNSEIVDSSILIDDNSIPEPVEATTKPTYDLQTNIHTIIVSDDSSDKSCPEVTKHIYKPRQLHPNKLNVVPISSSYPFTSLDHSAHNTSFPGLNFPTKSTSIFPSQHSQPSNRFQYNLLDRDTPTISHSTKYFQTYHNSNASRIKHFPKTKMANELSEDGDVPSNLERNEQQLPNDKFPRSAIRRRLDVRKLSTDLKTPIYENNWFTDRYQSLFTSPSIHPIPQENLSLPIVFPTVNQSLFADNNNHDRMTEIPTKLFTNSENIFSPNTDAKSQQLGYDDVEVLLTPHSIPKFETHVMLPIFDQDCSPPTKYTESLSDEEDKEESNHFKICHSQSPKIVFPSSSHPDTPVVISPTKPPILEQDLSLTNVSEKLIPVNGDTEECNHYNISHPESPRIVSPSSSHSNAVISPTKHDITEEELPLLNAEKSNHINFCNSQSPNIVSPSRSHSNLSLVISPMKHPIVEENLSLPIPLIPDAKLSDNREIEGGVNDLKMLPTNYITNSQSNQLPTSSILSTVHNGINLNVDKNLQDILISPRKDAISELSAHSNTSAVISQDKQSNIIDDTVSLPSTPPSNDNQQDMHDFPIKYTNSNLIPISPEKDAPSLQLDHNSEQLTTLNSKSSPTRIEIASPLPNNSDEVPEFLSQVSPSRIHTPKHTNENIYLQITPLLHSQFSQMNDVLSLARELDNKFSKNYAIDSDTDSVFSLTHNSPKPNSTNSPYLSLTPKNHTVHTSSPTGKEMAQGNDRFNSPLGISIFDYADMSIDESINTIQHYSPSISSPPTLNPVKRRSTAFQCKKLKLANTFMEQKNSRVLSPKKSNVISNFSNKPSKHRGKSRYKHRGLQAN